MDPNSRETISKILAKVRKQIQRIEDIIEMERKFARFSRDDKKDLLKSANNKTP